MEHFLHAPLPPESLMNIKYSLDSTDLKERLGHHPLFTGGTEAQSIKLLAKVTRPARGRACISTLSGRCQSLCP